MIIYWWTFLSTHTITETKDWQKILEILVKRSGLDRKKYYPVKWVQLEPFDIRRGAPLKLMDRMLEKRVIATCRGMRCTRTALNMIIGVEYWSHQWGIQEWSWSLGLIFCYVRLSPVMLLLILIYTGLEKETHLCADAVMLSRYLRMSLKTAYCMQTAVQLIELMA